MQKVKDLEQIIANPKYSKQKRMEAFCLLMQEKEIKCFFDRNLNFYTGKIRMHVAEIQKEDIESEIKLLLMNAILKNKYKGIYSFKTFINRVFYFNQKELFHKWNETGYRYDTNVKQKNNLKRIQQSHFTSIDEFNNKHNFLLDVGDKEMTIDECVVEEEREDKISQILTKKGFISIGMDDPQMIKMMLAAVKWYKDHPGKVFPAGKYAETYFGWHRHTGNKIFKDGRFFLSCKLEHAGLLEKGTAKREDEQGRQGKKTLLTKQKPKQNMEKK